MTSVGASAPPTVAYHVQVQPRGHAGALDALPFNQGDVLTEVQKKRKFWRDKDDIETDDLNGFSCLETKITTMAYKG